MLDYKQGQLDQLKSQLPPEVHEAVEKAGKLLADFIVKVKAFNTQVLLKAEEFSAKIQIGDKTLADYIFNAKQQKVIWWHWCIKYYCKVGNVLLLSFLPTPFCFLYHIYLIYDAQYVIFK